jgi:hypothetical protein
VPGGEDDNHDVGDAGNGEGDEGGVDDRDGEETEEAKAKEKVQEWRGVAGLGGHDLDRSCGGGVDHGRDCCCRCHGR